MMTNEERENVIEDYIGSPAFEEEVNNRATKTVAYKLLIEDRDKWKNAYSDQAKRYERAQGEISAWGEITEKLLEKI